MHRTKHAAYAALLIAISCLTGCSESAMRTRVKSPIELLHTVAFGGTSLTKSEYMGSDHARDWAMAEHAEAVAKQSQEFAASMAPQNQQPPAGNQFNQAAR